jgi:hypothetical protein
VATYGTRCWTVNKNIIKRLAAIERKVLRRMFEGIQENENWRKRFNKELMQMFEDLHILSFFRISRLNWIGHVKRMFRKRNVSQLFKNNPHGSPLRQRPKIDGILYKQVIINAKLQIGKRNKKAERTGRSPLRRRRSATDCSAIEEEEEYLFFINLLICKFLNSHFLKVFKVFKFS